VLGSSLESSSSGREDPWQRLPDRSFGAAEVGRVAPGSGGTSPVRGLTNRRGRNDGWRGRRSGGWYRRSLGIQLKITDGRLADGSAPRSAHSACT
jgi:hypothetical protein